MTCLGFTTGRANCDHWWGGLWNPGSVWGVTKNWIAAAQGFCDPLLHGGRGAGSEAMANRGAPTSWAMEHSPVVSVSSLSLRATEAFSSLSLTPWRNACGRPAQAGCLRNRTPGAYTRRVQEPVPLQNCAQRRVPPSPRSDICPLVKVSKSNWAQHAMLNAEGAGACVRPSTRPLIGNHPVNYDHNHPMRPNLQMRTEAAWAEIHPACYQAPLFHVTSVREHEELNVNLWFSCLLVLDSHCKKHSATSALYLAKLAAYAQDTHPHTQSVTGHPPPLSACPECPIHRRCNSPAHFRTWLWSLHHCPQATPTLQASARSSSGQSEVLIVTFMYFPAIYQV